MKNTQRKASVHRKTNETDIALDICLDGKGVSEIDTGVPFFDHMLDQTVRHGFLDLTLKAEGDIEVDYHHTVEDVGICIGQGIRKALGDASGIRRYGHARIPMDDSLADVTLDISGRPYLVYRIPDHTDKRVGRFPISLAPEYFRALIMHAGITLHIHVVEGNESHHMIEAVFKAFGRALAEAVSFDERIRGIPSTKGVLV